MGFTSYNSCTVVIRRVAGEKRLASMDTALVE